MEAFSLFFAIIGFGLGLFNLIDIHDVKSRLELDNKSINHLLRAVDSLYDKLNEVK